MNWIFWLVGIAGLYPNSLDHQEYSSSRANGQSILKFDASTI